jgi:hypothetical protein
MEHSLDPMMLGHNQFIGVSHLSQDAARSRVERFGDLGKVGEVVRACREVGVGSMMLSTHPRARDILDYLKSEGLAEGMGFYPLIPYAQGYVRRMNAVGMTGLAKEIFSSASTSQKLGIAARGGAGVLTRDFTRLLGAFVDIEMLPFNGFNVRGLFIHEAITDLGLALGAREPFEFFIEHVKRRYGATPGFVTLNFARLADRFNEWGLHGMLVMAPFNSAGFQMNPSREECEERLARCDLKVVAMSALAAGYLKPEEAFRYVCSLPNIASVIVGVSTAAHALESFETIRRYRGGARGQQTG